MPTLRLSLCLLLLSLPAWGWGVKKELLEPRQRRLCLTYKALHQRRIRYRLVQDRESRRRFPPEQIHAEIASALRLWSEPLGRVRLLRTQGECDLQVEFGLTPAGDTSNGAFTALASDFVRVRINIDHLFHETRSLPGNPNGDYPWRPFPSLSLPGSHQSLGDVAQQLGLSQDTLFWTSYRAFTHEFGHAFGLADTNELLTQESSLQLYSPGQQPDSIMKSSSYFYLTPDDLEGLRQAQALCKNR